MDSKKEVKNNNHYVSYKKLLLIFGVTFIIIAALAILFYVNINKDTSKVIKGSVKYKGDDYLILSTNNSDKDYLIDIEDKNVAEKCEVGDELSLTIDKIKSDKDPIEAEAKNVKIIKKAKKEDELIIEEKSNQEQEESQTTNNENSNTDTKTNNSTSSNNNSITNNTNPTSSSQSTRSTTEGDVVTYFNTVDAEVDRSINNKTLSESAKTGFTTIVDFLFYDKPIKGRTFESLTSSAKLKLLKLGIAIDRKIESKFPGYKETLSNKYQNIKSKAITKYLDKTTEICSKNEDTCAEAKKGLTDLKNNFSITWSFIKDISGVGLSKLKSWYEIWRET